MLDFYTIFRLALVPKMISKVIDEAFDAVFDNHRVYFQERSHTKSIFEVLYPKDVITSHQILMLSFSILIMIF